jgi:Cytochrome b5-like Heme/Steroid binding domain
MAATRTSSGNAPSRVFTVEEVAKHNTEKDCYIIVHRRVYDVTQYMDDHPGGYELIFRDAGLSLGLSRGCARTLLTTVRFSLLLSTLGKCAGVFVRGWVLIGVPFGPSCWRD